MTNTKAQVGDLIRIVNAVEDEPYDNGDIFEVDELALYSGDVYGINPQYIDRLYIEEDEYVIHRKAGEEDSAYDTLIAQGHRIEQFQAEIHEGESVVPAQSDAVEHPSHYTQGKFETIEVIEEITSGYNDGYVAYCVGNALKYEARAPFKHDTPLEDLRKAAKYLAFAIDYLDAKSTQTIE